jgi:N-acetylmuramoyl-L-alanine amidase
MRTKLIPLLLVTTVWGCGQAAEPPAEVEQQADDSTAVSLEGDEVGGGLDGNLESAAFDSPTAFARLGLMWDAPASGAIELRASPDGVEWTDWQAAVEVFAEGGSFAGHIDVPEGAQTFQFRAVDETAVPTWVTFAAIDAIPVPVDGSEETAPEEAPDSDAEPIGTFTIHSRASWGARAPRCESSTVPVRATIHHTVTPTNDSVSPQQRLRQIQAYHMYTMGWCDIGYNYLVSRDGRVWKGRGKNHLGAHVANNNGGNVGISFMGNYSSTQVSQPQRCNAAHLLRWLHGQNPAVELDRDHIKGHRQYGGTSCPGNALYNQLGGIVTLARNGGC